MPKRKNMRRTFVRLALDKLMNAPSRCMSKEKDRLDLISKSAFYEENSNKASASPMGFMHSVLNKSSVGPNASMKIANWSKNL